MIPKLQGVLPAKPPIGRSMSMGCRRATARVGACLMLLWVAGRSAARAVYGPNLVHNPSFESGVEAPDDWRWGVSRGAKASMTIDAKVAHTGRRSVRIHNESGYAPHVYGGLSQRISGIAPGSRYRLRLWVRGRGVHDCWFGGGPGWRTRKAVPEGDFDWRAVELFWTAPEGVTTFDLRINTDAETQALWVDDVSFQEVDPLTARPRVEVVPMAKALRYGLIAVPMVRTAPRIDGNLDDWGATPPVHLPGDAGRVRIDDWKGPEDLSVDFRAVCTPEALFLAFDVQDDRHWAPDGAVMWRNDSVQIAFDPRLERTAGGYGEHDSEYSLARTNKKKVRIDCWQPSKDGGDQSEAMQAAVVRTGNHTRYEVRIPWTAVGVPVRDGAPAAFGFSFLVNDNDGSGRRGYLELSPGIGKTKAPSLFPVVFPAGDARMVLQVQPFALVEEVVPLSAYYVGKHPLPARGMVRFSADVPRFAGLEAPLPPGKRGLLVARAALTPGVLPPGRHMIRVELLDAGTVFARAQAWLKVSDVRRRLSREAAALRARLARAQTLEKQARDRGIPTDYERVTLATVAKFIGYMLDDVDHHRIRRAEHVARVLDESLRQATAHLEEALAARRKPLSVPRLRLDGPVEIRDGAFWADTVWSGSGRRERRPVFFTGYGHFGQVVRDIPQFPDLGVNIIQIEVGPWSTQPQEDVTTDAEVRRRIGRALDLGEKYNVMVCMLGSPHYFPKWALKKWPNLGKGGGGFLHYTVDAPQAREILKKHFEIAVRTVKDSPALHSVCLSNEPVYTRWQNDPFRRPLWAAFLKRVYGSIEALNRVNGTHYADFSQAPVPPTSKLPPESEMTPIRYDAVRFNMDQFAGFHRFLSDVVHHVSPRTWTHAKVMNLTGCRQCLNWGCDPEEFAALADLNGNDCSMYFRGLDMDGYASEWQGQARYYDLQYSMRRAPIFNSEDHIIRDREQRLIPPEHTDCAIWQGAIHGQGAAAIWVWERTYDRKSDFEGSILHRPENVISVGRAALDLMRLAPEVTALQKAEAPIAVLFSITAQAWSDDATAAFNRVHEALAQTGWPVRFVSEKQAASGALNRYRALVLPATRHLPQQTARAVAEFARGGGRLWIVGPAPERDEHDQSLAVSFSGPRTTVFPADLDARGLRASFLTAMSVAGLLPPVTLETPEGVLPWGVEFRSTPWEKGRLVSVVNYWARPLSVRVLVDGKPVRAPLELRSNRILGGRFLRLEPLRSLLLYVR